MVPDWPPVNASWGALRPGAAGPSQPFVCEIENSAGLNRQSMRSPLSVSR